MISTLCELRGFKLNVRHNAGNISASKKIALFFRQNSLHKKLYLVNYLQLVIVDYNCMDSLFLKKTENVQNEV